MVVAVAVTSARVAAIPDGTDKIHGCYDNAGKLRVIDDKSTIHDYSQIQLHGAPRDERRHAQAPEADEHHDRLRPRGSAADDHVPVVVTAADADGDTTRIEAKNAQTWDIAGTGCTCAPARRCG